MDGLRGPLSLSRTEPDWHGSALMFALDWLATKKREQLTVHGWEITHGAVLPASVLSWIGKTRGNHQLYFKSNNPMVSICCDPGSTFGRVVWRRK